MFNNKTTMIYQSYYSVGTKWNNYTLMVDKSTDVSVNNQFCILVDLLYTHPHTHKKEGKNPP